MMNKFMLLFVMIWMVLITDIMAVSVVKLDIDARTENIELKSVKANQLKAEHPEWAKTTSYLIYHQRAIGHWQKYEAVFLPLEKGELEIDFRGLSSAKGINIWTFYRNIQISGADILFTGKAPAHVKGLPPGEIRAGHFHKFQYRLAVEKERQVIISFEAKEGERLSEDAFTKKEYYFAPPCNLKAAMKFEIDGRAAMIPINVINPGEKYSVRGFPAKFSGCCEKAEMRTGAVISQNWKRFQFAFLPELSGDLVIVRRNAENLNGKAEWLEFMDFKIEGARHRYAPRCQLNIGPEGNERMSYRAPLKDILTVQKKQKVTVEFLVRKGMVEPESKYDRKMWNLFPPPSNFTPVWKDKNIKLLGASEQGVSYAMYGSGSKSWNLSGLPLCKPVNKSEAKRSFAVPVEFLEEDGIERTTLVRFGFPLPEAGFYNVDNIGVFDERQQQIPALILASGFWPDHSIKWLVVECSLSLKAHQKIVYRVCGGKKVDCGDKIERPLIRKQREGYMIDTGRLQASVDYKSAVLLKDIVCDGKKLGDLTAFSGKNEKMRIARIIREEAGTLLRIDGDFIGEQMAGSFTARLKFQADSPVLRMAFTYRAENMANELNELESLHVCLNAGKGRLKSGALRIFQGNDLEYFRDDVKKNGFMPETDCFIRGEDRVSFGLTNAGKRYPKAFVISEEGLDIQLLPKQPTKNFNADLPGYLRFPYMGGNYRLMAGVHFTEDLIFDFSGNPVSGQEIVAVLPDSWYAETNAIRGVLPEGQTRIFDENAIQEFYRHLNLKKKQREYGFLNYGDWFGERGGNWGNNEYDFAYGLLTLFARTGNRDIYRLGVAAARHQSDVDIIHATPFKQFLGGNFMHCVGHTGRRYDGGGKAVNWYGGAVNQAYANTRNGHSWCGGMFTAFAMCGKRDIGDSAWLLAEAFCRDAHILYSGKGNPRSHGWLLEGLMQAYDFTGGKKYIEAGEKVANGFFKMQNEKKEAAWFHQLPEGYLRGMRKEGYGSACFQIAVVIQALHHYFLRSNRPEILVNLHKASSWLRNCWNKEAAGWPYVSCSDSTSFWPPGQGLSMLILAGVKADGDVLADDIYLHTLGYAVLRGAGCCGSGKSLAMDLVFAPVIFEQMKNIDPKIDLSLEAFVKMRMKCNHLMNLRGNNQIEVSIKLKEKNEKLILVRKYDRGNKNGRFKVVLYGPDKVELEKWEGGTGEETSRKCWRLTGGKDSLYRVVIQDCPSGYWNGYCEKKSPVRIKLTPDMIFANGAPLAFRLRVPAGIKEFFLKCRPVHYGQYGMMVVDSQGNIVGKETGYSSSVNIPWQRKQKEAQYRKIHVFRENIAYDEFYYMFTWSQRDLMFELQGIPEYLEYVYENKQPEFNMDK